MNNIYIIIIIGFLLINTVLGFIIIFKKSANLTKESLREMLLLNNDKIAQDISMLSKELNIYNTTIAEIVKTYGEKTTSSVGALSTQQIERLETLNKRLEVLTSSLEVRLDKNSQVLENSLNAFKVQNEQKLEQMRLTVDEKLNESLERRLNESFNLISERLENVSKGLGEMKSLAGSVGDLKKVLTNVKTRGTFGEVQLGNLLEQMLAPNQFKANVTIKDNQRVDYVIELPGKDERNILLPVDAKFPIEDYIRIVDGIEKGDLEQIPVLNKKLEKRIKDEAKSISEKYISVPMTTDFALLYLPLEGLYSEALKREGLIEELQREYRVIVCGPTTLSALLNSLQMGFKTLAIEKRSSEIWDMLSTFKKEFVLFVDLLTKTQKKIDEASSTISDATKKTTKIQKQLNKVVLLDDNINDDD